MQPPQLPTPSGLPGFDLTGVLPYCLAAVTGVLGWFGSQFTAGAQLQRTILNASRQWVEQSQERHAQDSVHALELETEIRRLRSELNAGLQREASLRNFMKRHGLQPPARLPKLRDDA